MTIEKKLESLIHVVDICTITHRYLYQKIEKQYNLTPKQMKVKYFQAQNKYFMNDDILKDIRENGL